MNFGRQNPAILILKAPQVGLNIVAFIKNYTFNIRRISEIIHVNFLPIYILFQTCNMTWRSTHMYFVQFVISFLSHEYPYLCLSGSKVQFFLPADLVNLVSFALSTMIVIKVSFHSSWQLVQRGY